MIHLIALCKVPVLKKFGINKIFKPFMEDIKQLEAESGVSIEIEEQDEIFRGSIGPFTSDNLGAHTIGGYLESFNGLRICRFCMATKQEINCKFHENDFQLRTRNGHDQHCALVNEDPSLASVYGVKSSSILNQSKFFHVVDGLVPDVMHDQLEGVLPLTVKLMLKHFIQQDKYLTLNVMNQRIRTFCYGSADGKNKPSELKPVILSNDSAAISQSASQMWCLSRLLPLMIGDLVPEENERRQHFILLLQIEEIVFAPKTTVQLAAYLDVLVGEYLEGFIKLNERPIIPKQHYMVHYPGQIVRNGPLVRNWAMRFEAKHNYFKRLVGTINNLKNIELSLTRRHQALQTYLLQGRPGHLFKMSLDHGPTDIVVEAPDELCQVDERITIQNSLQRTTWVKVLGTKYCKGSVVVTGLSYGDPVLGEVTKIYISDKGIVVFYYERLEILKFEKHLNAYKVVNSGDMDYIAQDKLIAFHPLGKHNGFGQNSASYFVVLRHRVDCMQ